MIHPPLPYASDSRPFRPKCNLTCGTKQLKFSATQILTTPRGSSAPLRLFGSSASSYSPLLSSDGATLIKVILNRLVAVPDKNLPEAQCGFRPGRSTVDMIFVMRQLQEKCIEPNMPLYSVFIDLTKAFDTIGREALWTVLERTGCPPKFVKIIKLFHVGMTCQVLWERDGRLRNQQRCEAGLCSSSSPFQHLLHLYAVPRRWRPGEGGLDPVPAGRLPL